MDAFALGRHLCEPGGGRVRWVKEDLRERLSRPLPIIGRFAKYKRVSSDNYITPLMFRLQWFPWPDAFTSLHAQRRVLQAYCAATVSEDDSFVEYGGTLTELATLKRAALGQTGWSVESISNQWWGVNVVSSNFTLADGVPGPAIAFASLADAYSLVPTRDVCVNYVGNTEISPLSFGELALYRQAQADEQNSGQECDGEINNADNIELLDLRGGRWTEILYGTRYMGSCLQPAPQLRDVPTQITSEFTPNVIGRFYGNNDREMLHCHIESVSLNACLKILHELQATFFEGAQRLLYPSISILDSHGQMTPCSKWDTEDCFHMTENLSNVSLGFEDIALNAMDETGLIAFVTRFSLLTFKLVKKKLDLAFFGAIALSPRPQSTEGREMVPIFSAESVKEACTLAEDLPVSLASKFLLFPTAFLAKLLEGEKLDVVQAWWVAASLGTLAEAVYSCSTDSSVRRVFHMNDTDIGLDRESTMCQLVSLPTTLFFPARLHIDWNQWYELHMHDGSVDFNTIMNGLNNNEAGSRIILKSLSGQKFSHDPISSSFVDDKTGCEKTVEQMPSWADDCIGLVYATWRHLIIFFPFRSLRGTGMQIGTIWHSFPVRKPTWNTLREALVECLDWPWEMKSTSHLGLAADILHEMGSERLANVLLTCMAIYGEIRSIGTEGCISAHLVKSVGLRVKTSVTSGPSVPPKCLRIVDGNFWMAVTPGQWLGPFREVEKGVLHGKETRLVPPVNIVADSGNIVPIRVPDSDLEYYRVGAQPLYMEEVAKLCMSELKFKAHCGDVVRGIQVPTGSLLLVLNIEKLKTADFAAEIGFNLKIVKGKVNGRFMRETYGKLVNNQRALENAIENIQRRRNMEPSSRSIASSIIVYTALFGNLKISQNSVCKAWVPTECMGKANGGDGFILNHKIGISGRTRLKREEGQMKIGLTATSSLDLKVGDVVGESIARDTQPMSIQVTEGVVTRYSTGTSLVGSWSSAEIPGYLF